MVCAGFKQWKKNEFGAMFKFFHMKGTTPKEIKAGMDEVHGTSLPALKTDNNWI